MFVKGLDTNCTCVRGEENVLDTISVNWCFSL